MEARQASRGREFLGQHIPCCDQQIAEDQRLSVHWTIRFQSVDPDWLSEISLPQPYLETVRKTT